MNKKFLLLFLTLVTLLYCHPLWAEEDNPWDNVLQFKPIEAQEPNNKWITVDKNLKGTVPLEIPSPKVTNSLKGKKASPQDYCSGNPFAVDCTNPCLFLGPFPGGWIWRYQDPSLVCPDPYPFQIDLIEAQISNCGAACMIPVTIGIFNLGPSKKVCGDEGPECPTPGEMIYSEVFDPVILDAFEACTGYDDDQFPLSASVCVNGPFYVGVKLPCPGELACQISPCLEIFGADTCGSWYWDCDPKSDTLNVRCDLNLPNFCIKAFGLTKDQNTCPQSGGLCARTNLCVALDSLRPCALPGPLPPGIFLYSFQDPQKACPPISGCPTYPFEVATVKVMLSNCSTDTCLAFIEPSIWSAIYPLDTLCPKPGNRICLSPRIPVKIPPGGKCMQFTLPLPETCCVEASYFACVRFDEIVGGNLQICIDSSCMPYWNYVQYQTLNDACSLGVTGDFAIWTSGFPFCKNNCPSRDNRGIDTVYFTPGVYSGEVDVNLIFSIEVDDPLVNKNFSCNLELYIDGQLIQTKPETVYYQPSPGPPPLFTCIGFDLCSEELCGFALGEPLHCKPIERAGRPCDCRADIFIKFPFTGVSVPGAPPGSLRLVPIEIPCPPIICDPPPFFMEETYTDDDVYSTIFILPGCIARPGDLNGDNKFGLPDIIGLVNVVFKGANQPNPPCRGNANGDSMTNLTDIIYLVNTVFKGGPKPRTVPECCL